jgi:hypothetical protein
MDDVDDPVADPEGTVRVLLEAAGIAVPDDEIGRLARLYPGLRRSVERYYAVETGDETAASVFRAGEAS